MGAVARWNSYPLQDAWTGAEVLTNLAITYAWAGKNDLAIKQLEELVRIPRLVSYGQLRCSRSGIHCAAIRALKKFWLKPRNQSS